MIDCTCTLECVWFAFTYAQSPSTTHRSIHKRVHLSACVCVMYAFEGVYGRRLCSRARSFELNIATRVCNVSSGHVCACVSFSPWSAFNGEGGSQAYAADLGSAQCNCKCYYACEFGPTQSSGRRAARPGDGSLSDWSRRSQHSGWWCPLLLVVYRTDTHASNTRRECACSRAKRNIRQHVVRERKALAFVVLNEYGMGLCTIVPHADDVRRPPSAYT